MTPLDKQPGSPDCLDSPPKSGSGKLRIFATMATAAAALSACAADPFPPQNFPSLPLATADGPKAVPGTVPVTPEMREAAMLELEAIADQYAGELADWEIPTDDGGRSLGQARSFFINQAMAQIFEKGMTKRSAVSYVLSWMEIEEKDLTRPDPITISNAQRTNFIAGAVGLGLDQETAILALDGLLKFRDGQALSPEEEAAFSAYNDKLKIPIR